MKLTWRIFTNCSSKDSALKVAAKLFEKAGLAPEEYVVEPYHKGGFLITAGSEHPAQPWESFVVSALALSQRTGNGWLLSGSITEELDAWSNSSVISGITSVQIQALK